MPERVVDPSAPDERARVGRWITVSPVAGRANLYVDGPNIGDSLLEGTPPWR